MTNGIAGDLEKTELETITSFSSYAKIRKYEESSVFVSIFGVLEVVERRYDGTSGATRLSVFQPVQFCVVVGLGETGKHEVIWILQETMSITGVPFFSFRVSGWLTGSFVDDTELDDGRGIDRTTVGAHAAHAGLFGLLSDGELVF